MAGFARAAALAPVIEASERAIQQVRVGNEPIQFLSIGPAVELVDERELLRSAAFGKGRADLVAALAAPALAGADLSVIVTDGQPTSAGVEQRACTPLGTQDVGALAHGLIASLDAAHGVWLLLERTAFEGTVFLNCGTPTPVIRAALADRRLRCDPECHHGHVGERALVTIVHVGPDGLDAGAEYVDAYLAARPGAVAVRLHATTADLWSPAEPGLELLGARGSTPIALEGELGDRAASVQCPSREAGLRLCVAARPPAHARARPLLGLSDPVSVLVPDRADDLYQLPVDAGIDGATLTRLKAWQYDECTLVWERHRQLAGETAAPTAPGCEAAGATEIVLACGCLRGAVHHELVELRQGYSVDRGLAAWSEIAGYAARDATWFQEPDRVNGLAALLGAVAAHGSLTVDGSSETVGRVRLSIIPFR